MDERDTYIDALRARLQELRDAIDQEKLQVRTLLETINEKEERGGYIVKLLAAEGIVTEGQNPDGAAPMTLSDMAYHVLAKLDNAKPVHYRDLADLITAQGKLIPGREPAANLISHLSRDKRFVRTGRGMYALAEWGLRPARKGSPRRRTKREKRRGQMVRESYDPGHTK
jgi:hypothetical protein